MMYEIINNIVNQNLANLAYRINVLENQNTEMKAKVVIR